MAEGSGRVRLREEVGPLVEKVVSVDPVRVLRKPFLVP